MAWRMALLVALNGVAFATLGAALWFDGRQLAGQWAEVHQVSDHRRQLDGVLRSGGRLRDLIHHYLDAPGERLAADIAASQAKVLEGLDGLAWAAPAADVERLLAAARRLAGGFEAVRGLDVSLRASYRDRILGPGGEICSLFQGALPPEFRADHPRFGEVVSAVGAFVFDGNRDSLAQARQRLAAVRAAAAALGEPAAALVSRVDAFGRALDGLDQDVARMAARVASEVDDPEAQLADAVGHLQDWESGRQTAAEQRFERGLALLGQTVALLGVGFLAITLGISMIIARSIGQPIRRLAGDLSAIAEGDLRRPIAGTDAPDEIGAITRSLDLLKDNALAKRQVEIELAAAERRWRTVVETSPIGFSLVGRDDHRRLYANPKFREMLGVADRDDVGEPPVRESFIDDAAFADLRVRLERGEVVSGLEVERRRRDGTSWWSILEIREIEIDGRRVYMVWHYDMTARRLFEAELRAAKDRAEAALAELQATQRTLVQSERLASLGGLVAGVAHEINTPLGISLTSASLLAEESRHLAEIMGSGALRRSDLARFLALAQESSELLLSNSQRAAELIKSFKQVAVDQASDDRRRFNLKEYIDEVLMSLGPRLKRSALSITTECPDDIEVVGFPGTLAQVLTNFVMNSLAHGYDDGQSGRLRLVITQPDPERVELVYADDGKGIPEAVLPHIFDPFFTTNRGGGGSGLGLNIVYNLVCQRLQGDIHVSSIPGQGATFTIRFPRVL